MSESGRLVGRPRVLERIAAAARFRITTIIAPAGFGKTVALRQFLSGCGSFVCYDVPPDATTLTPFVRGLADALIEVVPTMRRSLSSALSGIGASSSPASDLAAWAASHLRDAQLTLAIDNLHVGDGDVEIAGFVAALVERTPATIRWIIASRSAGALPTASWLAYDLADLAIDGDLLAFTPLEARLASSGVNPAIAGAEVDELFALTRGWPAALTFALRTSTRAGDLHSIAAGTREMVYRYLAEQMWRSLDGALQDFLRLAAFLPWIDERFIAEAGIGDAASTLVILRESVGLTAPREGGGFELHDLFRDFILRQLHADPRAERGAPARRAAAILERCGHPAAALARYVDAGAVDDVARVLEAHTFRLLDEGHLDVVERALCALPAGMESAALLGLRAAIEDLYGRVRAAEALYARALDLPIAAPSLQVALTWRYSLLLYQHGRMDALPLLEALYRRPGLTNADRAHVAGSLAVSLAFCGEVERARTVLRDALDLAAGADDETQARTYGRASTVAFFAADEALLEEYAHAAVRIAEGRSLYALAARIYTTLSAQSTAAGDLRAAAAFAHKVALNAEKGGDPALFARGIREMMALEADMGNAAQVDALEARLAGTSYRGPMGLSAYRLAKAMVAIWAGDFAAALGILRAGEDAQAVYQQRLLTSLAAVCAAALGRVPACEALLDAYAALESDDTEEQPMFARSRGLSVRYAILATALAGRTLAARRRLRTLQPSERFRDLDAALDALTARNRPSFERAVAALEHGDEAGIARVLTVSAARASLIGDALANLTDTERAVLRALIDGHSNKAIADLQGRAVNTVRSQVSSILKKLDCRSRGEAVALARRRGLV